MGTYMAKPEAVERKWYVLDAGGVPMGRTAAEAARLLRGKHKPEFTPHVDTGDFIIIVNAGKAVLTGNKLDQKYYRTHSGYVGGLKETLYRRLMQKRPEFAMELAVKGMLPKNNLSRSTIKRLKIYAGAEHPHAAQNPETWSGNNWDSSRRAGGNA
ncbi:MAG: 50S ribosomal protein L13 [Oscillospiraceae bacterium]|nr:50S ribosomal protein L13 [Oscillospiraceae bacterium]